jgi:iron complex transport system substrate-binding protein
MLFPAKIICLTEETVETLHLLGRSDLIAGVSQYAERPAEAKNHPVVSQFIRSDIERIVEMKPDLVIGFSDIQKDIAKELIGRGLNVLVTNQRSLQEILDHILLLGRIVGEEAKAIKLVSEFELKLLRFRKLSEQFPVRPKVYFEEWDQPRLSCIRWVSELIEAAGGKNVFSDKTGSLARDREVTDQEIIDKNPDLILASWCGKKVRLDSFRTRPGYSEINAIKHPQVHEISSTIILQPGPALFVDGIDQLFKIFREFSHP